MPCVSLLCWSPHLIRPPGYLCELFGLGGRNGHRPRLYQTSRTTTGISLVAELPPTSNAFFPPRCDSTHTVTHLDTSVAIQAHTAVRTMHFRIIFQWLCRQSSTSNQLSVVDRCALVTFRVDSFTVCQRKVFVLSASY